VALQINLNDPDYLIEQVITKNCVGVGRVISVRVHRSPSAFALIEMSKRDQTYELASRFGGSVFGTHALIHLE
jgi:hypothetical protein